MNLQQEYWSSKLGDNYIKRNKHYHNSLYYFVKKISALIGENVISGRIDKSNIANLNLNLAKSVDSFKKLAFGALYPLTKSKDEIREIFDEDFDIKEEVISELINEINNSDFADIITVKRLKKYIFNFNIDLGKLYNNIIEENSDDDKEEIMVLINIMSSYFTSAVDLVSFYNKMFEHYADGKRLFYVIKTKKEISPIVDNTGNVYVSDKFLSQINDKELDLILLHESFHLFTDLQRKVNIMKYFLEDIEDIILNSFYIKEIGIRKKESINEFFMIISGLIDLINKKYPYHLNEMTIDRRVLFYLKQKEDRIIYIQLLKKYLDQSVYSKLIQESRIHSANVLNSFIEKKYSLDNFEIVNSMYDYYGLIDITSSDRSYRSRNNDRRKELKDKTISEVMISAVAIVLMDVDFKEIYWVNKYKTIMYKNNINTFLDFFIIIYEYLEKNFSM